MKLLILGGKDETTNAVINALAKDYKNIEVILENNVPRFNFLKKRIKKLGLSTVLGQILFAMFVPRYLKRISKVRISEICSQYQLNVSNSYKNEFTIHEVESVNNRETIEIIIKSKPDIVIVNGTRIISEAVLDVINVPIINMHLGITPKYRGVHGAYWALVNDDAENCGVTIHHVDKGIDTGVVIKQSRIVITKQDNYITYPYIQVGEGIMLEKEILKEYETTNNINTQTVNLPSKIWSHPTLLQYLRNIRKSK